MSLVPQSAADLQSALSLMLTLIADSESRLEGNAERLRTGIEAYERGRIDGYKAALVVFSNYFPDELDAARAQWKRTRP